MGTPIVTMMLFRVPALRVVRSGAVPVLSSAQQRRLVVVVAAALMVGVGVLARQEADRPFEGVPPPPPPEALARTTREFDLPVSTSTTRDHAPVAVSVLVTRSQLLVGGDANPIAVFPEGLAALAETGLPERLKRNVGRGQEVLELGNELEYFSEQSKALRKPPALAVLADALMPYSVLSEILSTAAWSRFERVDFAVRGRDGALAWLALPQPKPRVFEISLGPAPELFVTGEGFSMRWRFGKTAPDCDPKAAGAFVPKVDGAYDHRGLAECLRRVKAEARFMKDEARLTLHASPAVDWQTLVSVIDALLGMDGARPLFPEITFAGVDDGVSPEWSAIEAALNEPPPRASGSSPKIEGHASVGGASVSGGQVANPAAVVAGLTAGFRRCYQKGLREDPKMKGSVLVTARIGPAGEVLSAIPSGRDLSSAVLACVAARVSSAQFSPPEGGSATIGIPVTFTTE